MERVLHAQLFQYSGEVVTPCLLHEIFTYLLKVLKVADDKGK